MSEIATEELNELEQRARFAKSRPYQENFWLASVPAPVLLRLIETARRVAALESAIRELENIHHFFADEVEYWNSDEQRRADKALMRALPFFRMAEAFRPTGRRYNTVEELMKGEGISQEVQARVKELSDSSKPTRES